MSWPLQLRLGRLVKECVLSRACLWFRKLLELGLLELGLIHRIESFWGMELALTAPSGRLATIIQIYANYGMG